MSGIAVVGTGISGLHVALRLQQAGIETTLYAERSADELAAGRLLNQVVRFEHTRTRERALGVDHWDSPDYAMHGTHFSALGELALEFYGELSPPGSAVDFRIYLPRLMADYAERGGALEPLSADVESVVRLARRHELVVVASGRRSVAELFPRDPERSPYREPQRMLCAGNYRGIEPMARNALHFQLCPGVGEFFSIQMLSVAGPVHGINIETVPGGALEPLAHLDYEQDPAGFEAEVLRALAEHAPGLRERVDEREFGLTRPVDLLQGGIVPTVRAGWTALPDGGYAVSVGDAWVLNDPIMGQGANLGSHSAFELAGEIIAGPPYDEAFCRRAHRRMWEFARPVTEWSNAFLGPPPPHALELLGAASTDRRVADAFIGNFNDPPRMWQAVGTPQGTAGWLAALRESPSDTERPR